MKFYQTGVIDSFSFINLDKCWPNRIREQYEKYSAKEGSEPVTFELFKDQYLAGHKDGCNMTINYIRRG